MLLIAIVLFTGASALCGAAGSLGQLVLFRVIQGAGGGLMVPVGMAMLYRTFPPSERVRASSIMVVPTALAPALGPVIGGLFVTKLSWRWVFYVNVPIGIAAVTFGFLFLAAQRQENPGRFDLVGFLLAGAGLGSADVRGFGRPVPGLGEPAHRGHPDASGPPCWSLLIWVELRHRQPLIDIRLFSDRLFRSASAVLAIGSGAFIGTLFLVALFFQDGLGLSALQSGLNTFPEAIGVMAGSQVVTRLLYPSFGPRRIMVGGLLLLAACMSLLALVDTGTNLWWVRVDMFVAGYAMAHVFVPSQAAGFATISPANTGRASTLFNALRQLGSAVGVALLTTVVATVGPTHVVAGQSVPNLAAYHAAFLVAAATALIAAVCALTVSDAEAAPTIVPRRRRRPRPSSPTRRTRCRRPAPEGAGSETRRRRARPRSPSPDRTEFPGPPVEPVRRFTL